MKEVTKLATASYPEPDFGLIAQTTKDISRLVFFNTNKMEAVQEKAKRISAYALDLQTIIGEELVSTSTKAKNLNFGELFAELTEIDQELAKGKLKPDEVTAAKEARGELVSLFASGIAETIGKFRDSAALLQQKADDIKAIVLAQRVAEDLNRALSRQPELIAAIEGKKTAIAKLDEDRSKIIEAQNVIRARNIADIFKDFIPKDLEKIDLKKPEAEAIRLGVEVLKKILGEISEGFKYSDLADQRKSLDGKIDELDQAVKDLVADQTQNDALVQDLSAAMSVDAKRDDLMGEVNKLPVAFTGFADSLGNLSGTQVTEASVTALLSTIKTYLGNCLNARNKVIIT